MCCYNVIIKMEKLIISRFGVISNFNFPSARNRIFWIHLDLDRIPRIAILGLTNCVRVSNL